ncbi:hypothetical protein PQX77_022361 [Marasmius sp. AFHP31]|nr:hypothetical protein PQX77_022361 [Marasmius sp. AFHP31]
MENDCVRHEYLPIGSHPSRELTSELLVIPGVIYSFGALHDDAHQTNLNVNHNTSSSSPLVNLLTEARSLRRLELFHDHISAATLSLPIPWHHLIELSIILPVVLNRHSSLDPGQLMQGLTSKCHSLTTLAIILVGDRLWMTTADTTFHPVQWPNLQNLRIAFLDNAIQNVTAFTSEGTLNQSRLDPAIIQIFDSVTLPSLKKLSVGFYEPGKDEDSNRDRYAAQLPFEGLLQRSQCLLTLLEMFRPRNVGAEAVIRVLQQLETLVSLNLGYGRLTREKKWQSFTRVYPAPQMLGWINRNVAQNWQRDWLDRILREFLQVGSDADTESRADHDAFAVLPLCPRLEDAPLMIEICCSTLQQGFGGQIWERSESTLGGLSEMTHGRSLNHFKCRDKTRR